LPGKAARWDIVRTQPLHGARSARLEALPRANIAGYAGPSPPSRRTSAIRLASCETLAPLAKDVNRCNQSVTVNHQSEPFGADQPIRAYHFPKIACKRSEIRRRLLPINDRTTASLSTDSCPRQPLRSPIDYCTSASNITLHPGNSADNSATTCPHSGKHVELPPDWTCRQR
jgi:hypothetical protein